MRIITGVLFLLALPTMALAAQYELIYFTQEPGYCAQCKPVTPIVDNLIHQGRAITIANFQKDDRLFTKYGVNTTPVFILLKDGQVSRCYRQDAHNRFTAQFVSGIAPPEMPQAVKNILPVPPPPVPLPKDVPDRQKVARIEALERQVSDQIMTINVLRAELKDLAEKLKNAVQGQPGATGADGKDGKPGPAGKNGRDGVDGRDGAALSEESLKEINQLKMAVATLLTMERRFLIVDGKTILGDLTYKPGEPVVIDRKVILLGE